MNAGSELIREARLRRGIGVRALARLAGVTPGAVSQWESSEREGTLRKSTRDKALRAMGTSMEAEYPSPVHDRLERREDRVSLELHRAAAARIIMDPSVLSVIPANIQFMRERIQGSAALDGLKRWETLASQNHLGPLIDHMLSSDSQAISMRQTSPFLGILSEQERLDAIRRASR